MLMGIVAYALAASQFPPEIEMDRLLLRAERAAADDDDRAARAAMEKILALQREAGVEPAPEDHFRYARVWDEVGDHQRALESLKKYLELRGRDADHYREALQLVNHAEKQLELEREAERRRAEERELRRAERERADAARMRAEAERERLGPPPLGPAGMEFVWIPAGEFRMGSTSSEADLDEQPFTQVRISQGFWLGKHEVTNAQWQAIMGPDRTRDCRDCPAGWVNPWDFIRQLNVQQGQEVYRLPTEVEWEYAARAGTMADRYGDLGTVAWYSNNSGNRARPVGGKRPNAFGLYDMLGNVAEYVEDWRPEYPGGTVMDPRGPASSSIVALRGCSFDDSAADCRVPNRSRFSSAGGIPFGFRLLRKP